MFNFEKEKEHEQWRGTERETETETEIEIPKQAPISAKPHVGLEPMNCEIMLKYAHVVT